MVPHTRILSFLTPYAYSNKALIGDTYSHEDLIVDTWYPVYANVLRMLFFNRMEMTKNNQPFKIVVCEVVYIACCIATEQPQLTILYWWWSKHKKVLLILNLEAENIKHNHTFYNLADVFLNALLCVLTSLHDNHMCMISITR